MKRSDMTLEQREALEAWERATDVDRIMSGKDADRIAAGEARRKCIELGVPGFVK